MPQDLGKFYKCYFLPLPTAVSISFRRAVEERKRERKYLKIKKPCEVIGSY